MSAMAGGPTSSSGDGGPPSEALAGAGLGHVGRHNGGNAAAGHAQREILFLGFNQDSSCVVAGTEGGFCTFNTEPFAQGTVRRFENGGVGIVELLYRSNILALVGGGTCPQFPVSKVMLWDDTKRACVGELSFHSPIRAVVLRKDVVIVALDRKVYVYNFADLEIQHAFDTFPNPSGVIALSLEPKSLVLAYPADRVGSMHIQHLNNTMQQNQNATDARCRKTVSVAAHESDLCLLELNRTGTLVASASEKGTIIRVFSTRTGDVVQELRRGADRAVIYSVAFSANSKFLACTSDKCTIHVFPVSDPPVLAEPAENECATSVASQENQINSAAASTTTTTGQSGTGSLRSLQGLMDMAGQAQGVLKDRIGDYLPKYLTTETKRSVVRFAVQPTITKCAFGAKPNTMLVAGFDGSFSTYAFDTESGTHERLFFGSLADV